MTRWVTVVLGAVMLVLATPAASSRPHTGGTSIANAPVVPFGQQQFGNLAPMRRDNSGYKKEFWKISLVTGDRVKIDFEAVTRQSFDEFFVMPVGTTDYTLNSTSGLFYARPSANDKGELAFTAPQSGTYPVVFRKEINCCSGPGGGYDFNVFAHHALRLFLGGRPSVSTAGSIPVSARLADGTAISDQSLRISLLGIWRGKAHVLGAGTPKNGLARLAFRVPRSLRGRTIRLQAKGEGSAYVTTRSRAISVRVR